MSNNPIEELAPMVMLSMQSAIVCSEHAGLAVYRLGSGEPLLLMPAPHGFVAGSMAEGPLARLLAGFGRSVITFDPPGAFRSTRPARIDLAEMLGCATEVLAACGVGEPVDLVGHSMSGLCALGLAIDQPEAVGRLLLIGSIAGGSSVLRGRGLPLCWSFADVRFWRAAWLGMWLRSGRGSLAQHKRMLQLIWHASYHDSTRAPMLAIDPDDARRPAPIRDRWLQVAQSIDYSLRLAAVRAPTLVCVGRYDPQAPVACSEELAAGIPGARLVIFERSGHYPFVEEAGCFAALAAEFLGEGRRNEHVAERTLQRRRFID
jgi:pimeloyl-ACP methyl ester carboxylesterase